MLNGNDISKTYGNKIILNKIDICVKRGSIYGLIGESGCGKSTLLRILSGIYRGDSGNVKLAGNDINKNMVSKKKIFFMGEEIYYFRNKSVSYFARYIFDFYGKKCYGKFKELREQFEVNPESNFNNLSKGQQKQVMLWIGLSIQADIMILDEPFDGVDQMMRKKIKSLIVQEVADREMSVVLASHRITEIENLCDHIGILQGGKLIIEEEIEELRKYKNGQSFESLEEVMKLCVEGKENEIKQIVSE